MDERRVNIDEFFRRKLDNQSETPPPEVWAALEQRLDNAPPAGRKKPFPIWWFWTIIAVVFISATGIIAGYMTKTPEQALQTITANAVYDKAATRTHVRNITTDKTTLDETLVVKNNSNDNTINDNIADNDDKAENNSLIAPEITKAATTANEKNTTKNKTIAAPVVKNTPAVATGTPARTNQLISATGQDNKLTGKVNTPSQSVVPRRKQSATQLHNSGPDRMDNAMTFDRNFSQVILPSTRFYEEPATQLSNNNLRMIDNSVAAVRNFSPVTLPLAYEEPTTQLRNNSPDKFDDAIVFDRNFSQVILPSAYRFNERYTVLNSNKPQQIRGIVPRENLTKLQPVTLPGIVNAGEEDVAEAPDVAVDNAVNPTAAELLATVNPMSTEKMNARNIERADAQTATNENDITKKNVSDDIQLLAQPDTQKRKKSTGTGRDTASNTATQDAVAKKRFTLPIEAGVKAGLSIGTNSQWHANKFIIAPYIEARLPSKFSLIVQPSYQSGKAKVGKFENGEQSYHEKKGTDFNKDERVVRGKVDGSVITPNPPDTVFRTYIYTQVYDSVHVAYTITGRRQWDIELPLMARYRVSKTFSVMAGASVTYSSVLQTKEEVTYYTGLKREYSDVLAPETFFVATQGQPPPAGPAPKNHDDIFTYGTGLYSTYKPRQITVNDNFFRYGFMIGASATLKDRLMIDVMLHKTGVDAGNVPDKELQKIYTQPYLRVTVGYRFIK